jgi:hypothetical protein
LGGHHSGPKDLLENHEVDVREFVDVQASLETARVLSKFLQEVRFAGETKDVLSRLLGESRSRRRR